MRREAEDTHEELDNREVQELVECDLDALCRMIMAKTFIDQMPSYPTPAGNMSLSYNYGGEMRKVFRVFFEFEPITPPAYEKA